MPLFSVIHSHNRKFAMPVLDEVAVPRNLFREIQRLIDDLRPRPAPTSDEEIHGKQVRWEKCVRMLNYWAKCAYEHAQFTKTGLSDGYRGETIQITVRIGHDRHGFDDYLGHIGYDILCRYSRIDLRGRWEINRSNEKWRRFSMPTTSVSHRK